ncbi:hypothetical protein MHAE_15395 [Mycobacterium haemophilum DSM 44634]
MTSPIGRGNNCVVTSPPAAFAFSTMADGIRPHRVTRVGDNHRESDRQPDLLGDIENRLQHRLVAAGRNVGHELEQATAAIDHTLGDLFDLLAVGAALAHHVDP